MCNIEATNIHNNHLLNNNYKKKDVVLKYHSFVHYAIQLICTNSNKNYFHYIIFFIAFASTFSVLATSFFKVLRGF